MMKESTNSGTVEDWEPDNKFLSNEEESSIIKLANEIFKEENDNISNSTKEFTSVEQNQNTRNQQSNNINNTEGNSSTQSNNINNTEGNSSTQSQTQNIKKKVRTDNQRVQCATIFVGEIFNIINGQCIKEGLNIIKPNIGKQIGYNIDLRKKFISAKIYQIFIYDNKENKEIIKKMVEKEKDEFIYLMISTFEDLFKKYISKENDKILGLNENDSLLKSFPTIENALNKKREKYLKAGIDQEEIDKRLNGLKKYSLSFIKDIREEGKGRTYHRRRKRKLSDNFTLCKYEIIPEIENYFKNKWNNYIDNYIIKN